MLNKTIKYFLENRLITVILLIGFIAWGISMAPFPWDTGNFPRDPVAVDAIPDIGENQQIVFTKWQGRSPQDIEDQISYPLTTYLLGIPGVKSIRSSSIFGFSSIYIIFEEGIEFYWSRSRILEKLSSLPTNLLPENVQPSLGPDATALGQVFWYTLEGRDKDGNVTGGWDLHEIRTVQDYYVKYSLNAAEGVSEVASIGGYVKEYQIEVNPDALKAYDIPLHQVMRSVQRSNRDVGAKTVEINQAEYLVRGLGYIKSIEDIEQTVVEVRENIPVRVSDLGFVTIGPAARRGALDKGGAEVVGGVVVARYGANPLQVINNVKERISEISAGLPQKILQDGTVSQLTIVPFYDRSTLIYETLGTLEEALSLEILIAILVVIVMVYNLRASILISSLLPVSVLLVFVFMKYFDVDANIVALSGIAIAIGTMIDLGIILSENIIRHLQQNNQDEPLVKVLYRGASEVSSAILTAVSTTIVSFIPVFTLEGAEGKLFGPLAYTKTFALIAALIVTLLILPTLAYWLFGFKTNNKKTSILINSVAVIAGIVVAFFGYWLVSILLILLGSLFLLKRLNVFESIKNVFLKKALDNLEIIVSAFVVIWLLAKYWLPLGADNSLFMNVLFVGILVGSILGFFSLLEHYYRHILKWCLENKILFMVAPVLIVLLGANIWLGFSRVFGFLPPLFKTIEQTALWDDLDAALPGIGKEFMPALDEGSFLLMPTSMPHSGMTFNLNVVGQLDMLISAIPEVSNTVGKLGRVESALDPAPISMFENVINYKPEYALDEKGHRIRYKVDADGKFLTVTDESFSNQEILERGMDASLLIKDNRGQYFRNWRPRIQSPDDIWNEIVKVTKIPGVTSAPKLQPIETRLVMLQTGMRAPMGIKVYGPDLKTIEAVGLQLEEILKTVPSVKSEAVFADRIVGKPYLEIEINRREIGRYGLHIEDVQQTIETAIGGMQITSTVEGRERFPVRVRYPRELRDDPDAIRKILIGTPSGAQIPLELIADINYVRGPQMIRSEETFLVGYVLFDRKSGFSEVTTVQDARREIEGAIESGALTLPSGVSYKFSGSYENQVRAEARLSIIVPIVLLTILLILYLQFRSLSTSLMIFSGVLLAFSGGFVMIWLYGQGWFADFNFLGANLRDLFQMKTVYLSVAVWVGFIALFGIATDDGVLIATYLDQSFTQNKPEDIDQVRESVIDAGLKRVKPALMTVSTTMIALLPVLTSTGRGADIMVPMAIPTFGGMAFALISIFLVPVLYGAREELKIKKLQS